MNPRKLEGWHPGCNYLRPEGGVCNKCGTVVKREVAVAFPKLRGTMLTPFYPLELAGRSRRGWYLIGRLDARPILVHTRRAARGKMRRLGKRLAQKQVLTRLARVFMYDNYYGVVR